MTPPLSARVLATPSCPVVDDAALLGFAARRVDADAVTPETADPATAVGRVVGRRWNGWDGRVYFCDHYHPRQGFWLVAPPAADGAPGRQACVSERAIYGSYYPADRPWGAGP